MSGASERAKLNTRMQDAQRRSQELEQERSRLHDRVLETAASVRLSHERTAETMEYLAETGPAEYATRRRQAAERSRRLAEEEVRQIAELEERNPRERNYVSGGDDRPDADPS